MRLDDFLQRHAAHWAGHQRRPMSVIVGLSEKERPRLAFLWKSACAHAWLQAAASRPGKAGDPRAEAVRWTREHAETCAHLLAYYTDESDPFASQPEGMDFGADAATETGRWLLPGLSALLVELACAATAVVGAFHQDVRAELEWMAAGFSLERRYALSEAGRLASKEDGGAARLREAAARFRVPGELAWGEAYLKEARAALADALDRSVARACADALKEIPELDGPLWPLLEPHLERHAALFGLTGVRGKAKRLALRAALKFA